MVRYGRKGFDTKVQCNQCGLWVTVTTDERDTPKWYCSEQCTTKAAVAAKKKADVKAALIACVKADAEAAEYARAVEAAIAAATEDAATAAAATEDVPAATAAAATEDAATAAAATEDVPAATVAKAELLFAIRVFSSVGDASAQKLLRQVERGRCLCDAKCMDEMPSADFKQFQALSSGAIKLQPTDAKIFRDVCALPGAQCMIDYSTLIYVDLKSSKAPPLDPDCPNMDEISDASDYDEEDDNVRKCSFILHVKRPAAVPPPPSPPMDATTAARGSLSNAVPGLICNLLALEQLAHDCGVQSLDDSLLERMWTLYRPPDVVVAGASSRRRKQRSVVDDETCDEEEEDAPRRRRSIKTQ